MAAQIKTFVGGRDSSKPADLASNFLAMGGLTMRDVSMQAVSHNGEFVIVIMYDAMPSARKQPDMLPGE